MPKVAGKVQQESARKSEKMERRNAYWQPLLQSEIKTEPCGDRFCSIKYSEATKTARFWWVVHFNGCRCSFCEMMKEKWSILHGSANEPHKMGGSIWSRRRKTFWNDQEKNTSHSYPWKTASTEENNTDWLHFEEDCERRFIWNSRELVRGTGVHSLQLC